MLDCVAHAPQKNVTQKIMVLLMLMLPTEVISIGEVGVMKMNGESDSIGISSNSNNKWRRSNGK